MGRALWTGPCPYPRYIASSVGTKQIWWLTYANKSEKRSNATVVKLEVILKLLTHNHNTRTVFTSRTPPKRDHHSYTCG